MIEQEKLTEAQRPQRDQNEESHAVGVQAQRDEEIEEIEKRSRGLRIFLRRRRARLSPSWVCCWRCCSLPVG
jgi:hypothetical protein